MTSKPNYNLALRYMLLLLLWLVPCRSFAADVKALFTQANSAYVKGDFRAAAQGYQQIIDGGYRSAEVYYNLGNACYKQGEMAAAILNYEKAHKLAPGDEDINFNIQLANAKTTDKIEADTGFFLQNWYQSFILFISLQSLTVWSIVFWLLGSAVFAYYLFAATIALKKVSFYTGLACALLGLCTMLMAGGQSAYFNSHHQAIIFSPAVNIKGSPDKAAKNLFVLHEGTKVEVLERSNNWLRIRLANGNEGWIGEGDVREI